MLEPFAQEAINNSEGLISHSECTLTCNKSELTETVFTE